MTSNPLETRLREKIPTATPRPGFETRIQAMAREPFVPEKKSPLRRFALPALALITIAILLIPKDQPATETIVATPDPIAPTPLAEIEEPVHREIQGLKNDAAWTMSLFQKALPSISISQIQKED